MAKVGTGPMAGDAVSVMMCGAGPVGLKAPWLVPSAPAAYRTKAVAPPGFPGGAIAYQRCTRLSGAR